jgi:formamidopyrimidine-DNA glycosylase
VPELPEVETIASDLRPLLVGRTIEGVDLRFPTIVRHPEPEVFARDLPGHRVIAVDRRGKYMIFRLEAVGLSTDPSVGFADTSPPSGEETTFGTSPPSGEETTLGTSPPSGEETTLVTSPPSGEETTLGTSPPSGEETTLGASPPSREESRLALVVHLGMTGQLLHKLPEEPMRPHTHVVLRLDNGTELRYSDPRRFGRLLLGTEEELVAARKLPRLGPEPLDPHFTAGDLHRRLHGRRAPLKLLLLDQSVIAGVGNIYADEACYRARIRPDRPPARMTRGRVKRLHAALRESLRLGIANRGSSIDDYVDLYGAKGRQQEELQVYGRGGQPCLSCGRPLTLVRLGGRATVFCRRCQR